MGEGEKVHEVVCVLKDVRELDIVVTELQTIGVNRAEIGILDDSKLPVHLNSRRYEDDPNAPRTIFISKASLGDMEGALIGLGILVACVPVFITTDWAEAALNAVIWRVVLSGLIGGVIGYLVAMFFLKRYEKHFQRLIDHGGIVLWVNARNADTEQKILDLLRHHRVSDVHTHDLNWSTSA